MINVYSEIKPLKKVLLHRPGKELLNLTPKSLNQLLFDDIPYLDVAIKEHEAFAKVFIKNGVEVVYLEDLMAEVLEDKTIKEAFIKQFLIDANVDNTDVYNYLMSFEKPFDLVLKTMEGIKNNDLYDNGDYELICDPMPNLYFTRDAFMSIGNGVAISKMTFNVRQRETIYGDFIFKYHKDYKDTPKFYNRFNEYHIEGGDITILNDNTVIIGVSERTEHEAIKLLSKNLFAESNFTKVLALTIPSKRAFMHLDTVFSQVDVDTFVIHPEIYKTLKVEIIEKGKEPRETKQPLEEILADALGLGIVKIIKCGGEDIMASQREQWNDGSNCLCIAPGVVITYKRNEITNKLLKDAGIKVISIHSSELSRGRGGPRCMSMPLIRKD